MQAQTLHSVYSLRSRSEGLYTVTVWTVFHNQLFNISIMNVDRDLKFPLLFNEANYNFSSDNG